ncbi:cobalamin-dependent protein [Patescibacteria group bacterium]|nr:cobalamin-dependent protein [Patescibacteria group bacterium]
MAVRQEIEKYFNLSARKRFEYLCRFHNPAAELKRLCRNITPKIIFNQEGIEKSPRIMLIGAYELSDLPAGRFNAPPFGLQRLASWLRAAGVNAQVFDITSRSRKELFSLLRKHHFNLIGFSILAPTFANDIQLSYEVKHLTPTNLLVAGGHLTTARPDLLIKSPFDYLIFGYGEDPLLNVITRIATSKHVDFGIPGLWKRDRSGNFIGSFAKVPAYSDLKAYSFLLNPAIGTDIPYRSTSGLYKGFPSNRIDVFRFIAQGFCTRKCLFCSPRNFLRYACGKTPHYISLNAEDRFMVIDNILERLPKLKTIFINDDDFFADKRIAENFFTKIITSTTGTLRDVKFIISSRIDELDATILSLAKRAGVILINIGVESFSAVGLRSLNKNIICRNHNIPLFIARSLRMILRAGITPSANLIIFYPEVTWHQIYQTIKGALNLIEKGGEVNLTRYVRVYYGAEILEDATIPRMSYAVPILNNLYPERSYIHVHDTVLLPKKREMRRFSEKVITKRVENEERTKQKYCWSYKRAPQKVVQLIFLKSLMEEARKAGYVSFSIAIDHIKRIDRLIHEEFGKIGFQLKDEVNHSFPVLSLQKTDQKIATNFKRKLQAFNFPRYLVKFYFDLITKSFCALLNDKKYVAIKPYLIYLFFGKEKWTFLDLDDLDKYVVVQNLINVQPTLTDEQKTIILSAFEIKSNPRILDKLRLLANHDVWYGPDEQNRYSRQIKEMLKRLL